MAGIIQNLINFLLKVFRFKFSKVEEPILEKTNKLNKYEEVVEVKADKFKGKIFKKDQIDKLKSNKILLDNADKESNQSVKTEEEMQIYKKKKVMKTEKEDEIELNGKRFGKNRFSKKGLNLKTEEEEIDESLKESLKYSELNKKGKMRYENESEETDENKTKKYKKQKINISIDGDEYGKRLFSESNIDSNILHKKGLPTKIKIYKCVVWKNTDPDLTEEVIKSLFHNRNKSQGLNSSVIKKNDGMNLEETIFSDNEEKKKIAKFRKNKINKTKKK